MTIEARTLEELDYWVCMIADWGLPKRASWDFLVSRPGRRGSTKRLLKLTVTAKSESDLHQVLDAITTLLVVIRKGAPSTWGSRDQDSDIGHLTERGWHSLTRCYNHLVVGRRPPVNLTLDGEPYPPEDVVVRGVAALAGDATVPEDVRGALRISLARFKVPERATVN